MSVKCNLEDGGAVIALDPNPHSEAPSAEATVLELTSEQILFLHNALMERFES